jgi:hypothetical protein
MGKLIDETGNVFGRLTVVGRAGNKGTRAKWLCECECGNTKEVMGVLLRNGKVGSCGCLHKEVAANTETAFKPFTHEYVTTKLGARGFKLLEQYKSSNDKYLFECGDGHRFTKTAGRMLCGGDCPICVANNRPKRNNGYYTVSWFNDHPKLSNAPAYLYYIKMKSDTEEFIKIGITRVSVTKRLYNFSAKYDIEILKIVEGTLRYVYDLESRFKRIYNKNRYFPMNTFSGSSECFNLQGVQNVVI